MTISEEVLRNLIRKIILKERYLTLPTRGYNSWQWYSSGGDITDEEIDDEDYDVFLGVLVDSQASGKGSKASLYSL